MYKITSLQITNNNTQNFKASFYIDGKPARLHLSKLHDTNYVYIGSLRIVSNVYGKIMCGDGEVNEHMMHEEELFMQYTIDSNVYDKYIAGKIIHAWFVAGQQMTVEVLNQILTSHPVEKPAVEPEPEQAPKPKKRITSKTK
ncbi:hypothetical protein [Pantoea sp. S62]|uniref:hypothetical protein n=1 Tax=Pantoea sp. S62 TaxID=2769342 RepID=UPI0019123400|nr:hypothetical protein [Pantoea sp. S62]MBK5013984.1 hypothetical protein [Pantoea sp. S62]